MLRAPAPTPSCRAGWRVDQALTLLATLPGVARDARRTTPLASAELVVMVDLPAQGRARSQTTYSPSGAC